MGGFPIGTHNWHFVNWLLTLAKAQDDGFCYIQQNKYMQIPTCATVAKGNYLPIPFNLAKTSKQGMMLRSSGFERSIHTCSNSQPLAAYSTSPLPPIFTSNRPRVRSILSWKRRDCVKNYPNCPYHESKARFGTSTDGRANDKDGNPDAVDSSVAAVQPQTLESHWMNVTQRLLEGSAPSWDEAKFCQARNALYRWARQEEDSNRVTGADDVLSIEIVDSFWSLVERYCEEFESSYDASNKDDTKSHPHALKDYLFSAVINQWRKFIHRAATGDEGQFSAPMPLEMISKLDKYRSNGLVREMSISPYNMTFNAMTYYYKSGTEVIYHVSPGEFITSCIPEQAEAILDRLICDINLDSSLDSTAMTNKPTPDVVTFASVMKLWVLEGSQRHQSQATRRKARQRAAHRVLALDKRRRDLSQKLNHPRCLEPSYIYKSIIIDALSQAGQALRAQTMLEEWCHECNEVDSVDNKNTAGSHSVNSTQRRNPDNVGDGSKMSPEPPTMETFSTVVLAWSRSGHPRAAMHAENLLQCMIELYNNGREGSGEKPRFNFRLDNPPNIVVYSNVLGCLAKSDAPNAARRAEAILRYLQENQRPECRPNVVTYTSVIHAWAKRGNTKRALSLLEEMIRQEDEIVAPNDVTFNALLLSITDPQQALGVLNEMHGLADTHPTWKCRPTVVTYGTVMQILAKAKLPHHARNLLDEMIEYHSSADSTKKSMAHRKQLPKPDTTTCNIVLHGYSKLGLAEDASSLLKEMQNAHLLHSDPASYKAEETGNARTLDLSIPPDVVSFNSVLSAWSRSVANSSTLSLQKAHGAALEAEQIFTRMLEETPLNKDTHVPADSSKSSSIFDVRPTCVTYSTLLHCWSHVATALIESRRRGCDEDVNVTEADIVARCEALFKEMEDIHKESLNIELNSDNHQIETCKPNIVAYSNLFKVYATFGYHGTRIQEPLRDMKDIYSITPNAQWFVGLFNAWSHYCKTTSGNQQEVNGHHEIVSQAEHLLFEEISNVLNLSRQRKQDLSEIVNHHVITAMLKLVKAAKVGQTKSTHLERVVNLMAHSGIEPDNSIKRLVRQITEGNLRGSQTNS